jgi:hypothetical protein
MRLDPPDPGGSLEHAAHAAPVQMHALAAAGLKAATSLHGRVSGEPAVSLAPFSAVETAENGASRLTMAASRPIRRSAETLVDASASLVLASCLRAPLWRSNHSSRNAVPALRRQKWVSAEQLSRDESDRFRLDSPALVWGAAWYLVERPSCWRSCDVGPSRSTQTRNAPRQVGGLDDGAEGQRCWVLHYVVVAVGV